VANDWVDQDFVRHLQQEARSQQLGGSAVSLQEMLDVWGLNEKRKAEPLFAGLRTLQRKVAAGAGTEDFLDYYITIFLKSK
jgi:hypothetical protein